MRLEEIAWLSGSGPQAEIALSTRLRLARNLKRYPFPPRGDHGALAEVLSRIGTQVARLPGMVFEDVFQAAPLELHLLVERHLISPAFVASSLPRGLGLHQNGRICLMVNEEDHLRLQCLLSGLNFPAAWEEASLIEDQLAQGLPFAFDDELGYLTACPSNVGTGLRASAMLHLPALAWLNALDGIVARVSQLGLTVRGVYGEGTRSVGNLLQISNQITLGPSEGDILTSIGSVSEQLVQHERSARERLLETQGAQLEDRVWRCLGVLGSARLMVSGEALEHLSMVRLGVEMGILPSIPTGTLNALMVRIRPANLSFEAGRELQPAERDAIRAQLLRQSLAGFVP